MLNSSKKLFNSSRNVYNLIFIHTQLVSSVSEMPTAVGNGGMSTSEEKLSVNGNFSVTAPPDQVSYLVFIYIRHNNLFTNPID